MLLLLLVMTTYINNRFNFTIYKNDIKQKNTEIYDPYASSDFLYEHLTSLVDRTSSQTAWKVVDEYGIRYQGKNANNYVVFNNEKWRIIGVFNDSVHSITGKKLVKIIRSEPLPISGVNANNLTLPFDNTVNDYGASLLKNYLNNTYYSSRLTLQSRDMIEPVYWKKGTHNNYYDSGLINQYNYEQSGLSDIANVGLMYPSDYGFASLASACSRSSNYLYSYGDCLPYNWLTNYVSEWTITPSAAASSMNIITASGNLGTTLITTSLAVRPVVYLKENVLYVGGTGSEDNPYTIAIR